jgi:hypothetical protein
MMLAQKRRASGELKVVVPRSPESGVRLREGSSDEHRKIAEAMQSASLGFDVCARRASAKEIAERMTLLAREARAIADVAGTKVGGVRKPTTSERMRWEWLASTATLIDGGVEGRISDEANRHLTIAEESAGRADDDEILDRIARLAATSRSNAA